MTQKIPGIFGRMVRGIVADISDNPCTTNRAASTVPQQVRGIINSTIRNVYRIDSPEQPEPRATPSARVAGISRPVGKFTPSPRTERPDGVDRLQRPSWDIGRAACWERVGQGV